MPTYNRAHLLPDVIASIFSQDYQDLELLIVDDCSTDQTEQVIRVLQEQDGRLRYHKLPENKGTGFARQAGLESVSGKYIALADSDDLWIAGKLKTQIEVMENHPEIDIMFGDYWNVDHITCKQQRGFEENLSGMQHLSAQHIQKSLWLVESGVEEGILEANFIAVPTMIIRKEIFDKTGGFNKELRSAADLEFGFRAAALAAKFAYLDTPLIYRHRYFDSNTANAINSNTRVIQALTFCSQLCNSIHRDDLSRHVNRRIYRTYITLMYAYGQASKRDQVWNSYLKAIALGFSVRDFILFLISLGGPGILSFARRLRGGKQS